MRFDEETFFRLIEQALASLPEEFRQRLENVTVDVQPLPDRATRRQMRLRSPFDLFGLYHGTPLTQRSVEAPFAYPDRIVIYKRPIEAACASETEAVEQIRKTVLHEVGHFFGLDEADLDELGYG